MSAPALVLLASGSSDPGVAQVTHCMRKGIKAMRPALDVHVAFLDHCPPSGPQVVGQLARAGVQEIVFVPLDICRAFGVDDRVEALLAKVRAAHPGLAVTASEPLGPGAQLLTLVDRQLREALRRVHATELDGLVLAASSTDEVRSTAILGRRARQWSQHHRLPCVVAQDTEGAGALVAAVNNLRAQGRRHIAVGSWHLVGDDVWQAQAEAARALGVRAVSRPFGDQPELLDLALARYVVAAMELVTFEEDTRPAAATEERPRLSVVGA
ncbi:sirohydrochlorin chelatase [Desertihabitans aurantiacus]|uniref:sirohydrochlorin chelatase n=1 Tax=Desertihabitans aurantiacus TaxID=2282477 RepID=UPI0018E57AC5|nr:CbiX/SirB N-terminal domain-containing protein [Desertihabitans aurantiacus]